MNTRLRIFWLLSLLFFATGCSGYRVVKYSLPELTADSGTAGEHSVRLYQGDRLRLHLVSGERVKGTLYAISPEGVELGLGDDFTRTEVYPAERIHSIAKEQIDGTATAITVLAIFGSIALMAHAVQSTDLGFDMSDWDWGDGGIVY